MRTLLSQTSLPTRIRIPPSNAWLTTNSVVKSVAALERVAQQRIVGYMSPGPRPTPNTLEICAEQGFIWTADYSDSDVPYLIDVNGKTIVSVGYVMPNYTDNDLVPLGLEAGLKQLQLAFDASYEESRRHPMKFCYACHVHVSGRSGMSKLLRSFHRLCPRSRWSAVLPVH